MKERKERIMEDKALYSVGQAVATVGSRRMLLTWEGVLAETKLHL